MASGDTGDTRYRMRWPAQDLAKQAPVWRIINLDIDAAEQYEFGFAADLLVIYQAAEHFEWGGCALPGQPAIFPANRPGEPVVVARGNAGAAGGRRKFDLIVGRLGHYRGTARSSGESSTGWWGRRRRGCAPATDQG